MATTHFSISRFYGAKYGAADNLIPFGYAAEAVNVDTSDGALQTLVGAVSYPTRFEGDVALPFSPQMLWEDSRDWAYYISKSGPSSAKIVKVMSEIDETSPYTEASVIYDPAQHASSAEAAAAEQKMLARIARLFVTSINGERVVIGLCDEYDADVPGPILITWKRYNYEHDGFEIRPFGTGMFITSDAITEVITGTDSVITGVKIGREMTLKERNRCLYAGVYIMAHENEQLDFTAAYVSDCTVGTNETTITFEDALPAGSVSVGNYIKVRGGLSNKPVSFMHMHFGRLFAAGDTNFPNRLYWSCLPGDGRTIEDWTADDASPDTGGGYVQVGDEGYISALFSYQSQLLIWKGDELWRLYGATPSQYTLELVFRGAGMYRVIDSEGYESFSPTIMQERVADVHGVPYVLLDEGLHYYDGNSLNRVGNDRTLEGFLREIFGDDVDAYGYAFSKEISQIRSVAFWHGALYFCNTGVVYRYDIENGTLSKLGYTGPVVATRRGVMTCINERGYILLDRMSSDSYVLNHLPYDGWIGPRDWIEEFHYAGRTALGDKRPIDTVWESTDLTFGEVSYFKKLRRIGLDVTGPIRVILSTPEGVLFDRVYTDTDVRVRRLLWIAPDMPYEYSFRIRFESVDGMPFRVHNGIDFYVETSQRN